LAGQPDAVGVVVGKPSPINSEWFYAVRFSGHRDTYPEAALEPLNRLEGLDELLYANRWGSHDSLVRMITHTKLKEPLRDVIYAFRATRTKFEPFQFKPLIKFLESPSQRLLIADEVGLGKTIEAGYILCEMKARSPGSFRRVLVVCPSALRLKWQDEMWNRFEERFEILDSRGVRSLLRQSEQMGSGQEFQVICSLQTLRGQRAKATIGRSGYEADWISTAKMRPSLLDELEAGCPPLDLVIVDEAHHLRNSGTLSHRLGQVLRDKSDAMVFLTATPVHIGSKNLFSLLNLLDEQDFALEAEFDSRIRANEHILAADRAIRREFPADFDACRAALRPLDGRSANLGVNETLLSEIGTKLNELSPSDRTHVADIQFDLTQLNVLSHIFTRTRKRDVQTHRPARAPQVIRPQWTDVEAQFYEDVTQVCRHLYQAYHGEMAAQFAIINLQQQMASSLPALIDRYTSEQVVHESDDEEDVARDSVDDPAPDISVVNSPEFQDLLANYRPLLRRDSKAAALIQTLRELEAVEPGRKVVLFSFFKSTLRYLEQRMAEAGISTVYISGDIPSHPTDPDRDERGRRIRRFLEDPDVRVLLSSEVGAEGLDFQTASHILVNYDLPWNPMRVEQRIGRLDRIGQPSDRIIIFNFAIPGTIEDRILSLLYQRIRIFEETIGDLEPILGREIQELQRELMRAELTESELEAVLEDRARAIENRRQEQSRVEEASSQFMGHDEYFMSQIDTIDQKKQFLTALELEAFVGEYLRQIRNQWRPTGCDRVLQMRWSKELDRLLRDYLRRAEWSNVPLLETRVGENVLVTCDGEAGFQDRTVELLSEHHPLVRAICHQYEANRDLLHPVSACEVTVADVPSGDYLYFLYLLTQRGALRPGKYLEAVFIQPDGTVLDSESSGELLYEMTTAGASAANRPELDRGQIDDLWKLAAEELVCRRRRRLEEQRRANSIYLDNRMASLQSTYEIRRQKLQTRLDQGLAKSAQPRYIRMLEGGLRNLEADHERKVTELEASRTLDISFDCFAAGMVGVHA